jgi:hypothetical protein
MYRTHDYFISKSTVRHIPYDWITYELSSPEEIRIYTYLHLQRTRGNHYKLIIIVLRAAFNNVLFRSLF